MSFRRAAILLLSCILPFAAGCSRHAPPPPPPASGSIQGSIAFPGLQPSTKLSKDSLPPDCQAGVRDRHLLIEDKLLPHAHPQVFLWISAGLTGHSFPVPHQQAVLTQILCGFHPQIIGVLPGQPVDFTNTDPFPAHFRVVPHTSGNPTLTLTLAPDKPGQVHVFPKPELMIPVTTPDYPHTRAFINVVSNPYFTLSGSHGHFRLRGLPPGTYTLSAMRPGYPTKSRSVTVKANAVTHIRFSFPAPTPHASPAKK